MTATPASHPFEIREHDVDGVHVVAMLGELDLATAPRLAFRIDAARGRGARRLVVDLTAAEVLRLDGPARAGRLPTRSSRQRRA